jgi:hypothetical protein
VAWGVNGLVMRVARTVGVTGLVMSIIRALDSKLVVIDLVTVHHVYVHVGRLLRALQGVIYTYTYKYILHTYTLTHSLTHSLTHAHTHLLRALQGVFLDARAC